MPKVHHVKAARKADPQCGIQVGDEYYWWEFRHGGTHKSKTPPRPSQLTQSKMSSAYAAMEALEDVLAGATCPEDIKSALDDAAQGLRDVAGEYEESYDSMPEGLQNGPAGESIQEKIEWLNSCADELDGVDIDGFDYGGHEARDTHGVNATDFEKLTDAAQRDVLDEMTEMVNNVSLEV